jgi:hypothetical protein
MYMDGATVIMPDPEGRVYPPEGKAGNPAVYTGEDRTRYVHVYDDSTYDQDSLVDGRTPHVLLEDVTVTYDIKTHRPIVRPATAEAGMLAMQGTVDGREELIVGLVPPPDQQIGPQVAAL